MASVSASIAADEKHSLPSCSTSEDTDAQASDEHNVEPWITITEGANKRQKMQPPTVPTERLPSTPSEPALCQSRSKTRLPRLTPLPAEDCKLAIRPHSGINMSKSSEQNKQKAACTGVGNACHLSLPSEELHKE
ncbi:hypothetical protein HPB51_005183 [Rhipicephalus microplus]|uniref:Uncharacterized protein n=1 Tax=Rhipicephalus microplus TaxID=6941 RepID=A0A9J6E059_RHIMP|nr:hypothetical protein HPB51_005183 [Rhipicephalus microplus]